MFSFFKKNQGGKQLDTIVQRIQMNLSNNYKDAAQLNLKEFEETLERLEKDGLLGEAKRAHYHELLDSLKGQMKNFTHKDQKPYWT